MEKGHHLQLYYPKCSRMKKIAFFFLLSLAFFNVNAQIDSIERIKVQLNREKQDTLKIKLLCKLGQKYLFIKIDSSISYSRQAYNLSVKTGFIRGEIKANQIMTRAMNSLGNYSEALRLSVQSLGLLEQLKDTVGMFWVKRDMMWIYQSLGNKSKAYEYTQDLLSMVQIQQIRNSAFADRLSETAFRIAGNLYDNLKMNDSAFFYYSRSFNLAKNFKEKLPLALSTMSLGDYYSGIGIHDSALYYYRMSIPLSEQTLRPDLMLNCRLSMAKEFLQTSLLDSVFFQANLALEEARSIPDSGSMIEASLLLSDFYYQSHRPDSAYTYLKYAVLLKDRLADQEKVRKAQEMIFNETLHNQQLEEERKQADLQSKNNLKIYSLVGVLTIILSLALMFYRNSRQKQKDANIIKQAYDELKATQSQLIQSEKMASLGELTAGIAHEIQNPLNFVNNFSEVNTELIDELSEEADKGNLDEVKVLAKDIKENEQKINHHGKRADAIVKGMLQHSRSSNGVKVPTDINALADEYLRLAYHGLRAKDKSFNATLKTDFDETIGKIDIIPQDIGRVILNLITNAFYVVDEKKKLLPSGYEPTVSVSTEKINRNVEIKVADNGNGIPRNIVDKIFQPFFTTKPTGQGTGLGLSLSYDIVKAHGGELTVETFEGEGTTFIITLFV
jgi:two-component system, NtrC family, sensor kinase